MKNSIIYSVIALFTFIGTNFIGTSNMSAAEKEGKKTPGAIVVSLPPACDCTAPATSCYCITADEPDDPKTEF